MRLPLIEPFETTQADKKYEELFNNNKLIVNIIFFIILDRNQNKDNFKK